jgi:hypothetical protein
VIIVLAHALQPAHIAPPVERILLVTTTAAVCFLTYELIRRIRLVQPLFGAGREAGAEKGSRAAEPWHAPAGSF